MSATPIFEVQNTSAVRSHDARALLGGGVAVHVSGSKLVDAVEITRCEASAYLSFRVTSGEARALGAELTAAADAVDAARAAKEAAHG